MNTGNLLCTVQFSFPPAELPKSADGDGLSQTVSAKLLQSRYNINPTRVSLIGPRLDFPRRLMANVGFGGTGNAQFVGIFAN